MSDELSFNKIEVKPTQLVTNLVRCIRENLTPMVWGLPGIGKSEIIASIAKMYDLKLIDIRLTTCDITDLNGFPDNSGEKATYKVFDTFPIATDTPPINPETNKPYSGWLVFLDELPSVSGAMQASAYKLILDRMVGQHHLHPNCALLAAGNDTDHGAISYGMGTAAGTRMIHFNLVTDLDEWTKYGQTHGNIDSRIISFLNYRPELFHKFSLDSPDKTHPNPRTWKAVSKLISDTPTLTAENDLAIIAGAVGTGAANEFIVYTEVYRDLVKFSDIEKSPLGCRVPSEAANCYALTGIIIDNTSPKNLDSVIKYSKRLSSEFQTLIIQGLINKNSRYTEDDDFSDWMSDIIIEIT